MTRRIETLGQPDYTGQIASLGQRTAALEGKIAPIESTQALAAARAQEAVEIASDALEAATGATYTDEQARDAVGAALVGGDGLGIALNDPANTITVQVDNPQTLFNRLGLGTLATVSGTFAAGASVSGTNTGDQLNITGNAGTATRLATSRRINGVFFDGTGDITINAVDATPRQVQDADLDAIAALTTQPFGRGLLTYADAAGVRSAIGLGTAALVNTGVTNGTALLVGPGDKIPSSVLPALAITDVFDVASQAEMLALTAQRGDVAIRSDISNSYILATDDPTVLANWKEIKKPAGGGGSGTVTSVSVTTANGISGTVANPSTTPAITLTLGAITPSSVAATGTVTGSNLSGTNTGDQTSVTGNAGTATKLQTARNINGQAFDGTAAITITANWNASRTFNYTGDVTGTLATDGSADASSTLTIANNAVSNAKLAQVATARFKGRTTAGTGNVEDLTGTQATALLDVATTSAKGLVGQLPGNTTTFWRGDGTYAAIPAATALRRDTYIVYTSDNGTVTGGYYTSVAQSVKIFAINGSIGYRVSAMGTNGSASGSFVNLANGSSATVSLAANSLVELLFGGSVSFTPVMAHVEQQ